MESGDPTRDGGHQNSMRILRVIRLTRLLKILRIARVLRFVRALHQLVFSIVCTLRSLFWASILMALFMYVFGMVLARHVSDHMLERGQRDEQLDLLWGGLGISIYTLFKSISGGIDWHIAAVPLEDVGGLPVAIFIFYVSFLYFAVLNVITGVFCESAIESTRNDQEIRIQQNIEEKKFYINKIAQLFNEIDGDNSEVITLSELATFMDDELASAYFDYLQIDVTNPAQIIQLFDLDGGGDITLGEFIDSCVRLRGSASALHMALNEHAHKLRHGEIMAKLSCLDEERCNYIKTPPRRILSSGICCTSV